KPHPNGGRLPIWFGGRGPRVVRRIAKWGSGWLLPDPGVRGVDKDIQALRSALAEEGRKSEDVNTAVNMTLDGAETLGEAYARAGVNSLSLLVTDPDTEATLRALRHFAKVVGAL